MGKVQDDALIAAARSGDVAACRAALDGGADKNCKDSVRACAVRWLAPCQGRTRQPRHARAWSRTRGRARARVKRGAARRAPQLLPAAASPLRLRVAGAVAAAAARIRAAVAR
jgi:hypothetical protein